MAGLALDLGRARVDPEGDVEKALFARASLLRRAFPFPSPFSFPDHPAAAAAAAVAADAVDACCSHTRRREREREEAAATCPHVVVPTCYTYRRDAAPPEPRQRTRQLHLVAPRLCDPGATRCPSSSSSHRGLGRGGSAGGGGGGSLWRSTTLSITPRSRRKPAPLPDAAAPLGFMTSPAMTESATSVTSEVLPSYLPSPNFSSAADRMRRHEHKESDFAFETVPLSPPPPPLLHTREEAAEPDDLRMRELRGVYEAVARALGSVRSGPG